MTTLERAALKKGLEQIPTGRVDRSKDSKGQSGWGLRGLMQALENREQMLFDGSVVDTDTGFT